MIIFLFIFVNECKILHLPRIIDVFVASSEIPAEIRGQYVLMNSTIYRKGNIFIERHKGWVAGKWVKCHSVEFLKLARYLSSYRTKRVTF